MKVNLVLIGLFLMLFIMVVGCASAETHIPAGVIYRYSLSTPGETYILDGDVTAVDTAFVAAASGITVDGMGYNVTYSTTGNTAAITNTDHNNNTFKNMTLNLSQLSNTASRGVTISGTSNNVTVEDLVIKSGDSYGIYATGVTGAVVSGCNVISGSNPAIFIYNSTASITDTITTSSDGAGIYVYSSNSCTLEDVNAVSTSVDSGNNYGIYIRNSNDVAINNSVGYAPSGYGVYFINSTSCNALNLTGTSNTSIGFHVVNSTSCNFVSSIGESNTRDGLYLNDTTLNTFDTCIGDSVSAIGFSMQSTNNSQFINCTGESDVVAGIRLALSFENTFTGTVVNSPFATTTPDTKTHVLVVGDSITEGSADKSVAGGYGRYIETNLGSQYICSIQGISGDYSQSLDGEMQARLDIFNPDIVTILVGTNNLKHGDPEQDIIDDVLSAAEKSDNAGAIPYILLALPRIDSTNSDVLKFNINLSTQAKSAGYNVINTYDSLDSSPENGQYDNYADSYYLDGLHPNDAGNSLVGAYVARNILGTSKIYNGAGLTQTIDSNGVISNSRNIRLTDTQIPFNVLPSANSVNVAVSTWSNTQKVWTLSSETQQSVTHTIGGFPANTDIDIYRDGIDYDTARSNSTGYITWVYDGGFSEHEFEAIPHATAGTRDSFVRSWGNTVSMVGAIIVISLAGSMIAVFRGKREVTDIVNDLPGIVLIIVLLITGAIIFGQF